jgi:hypothetical protein
MHRISTGKALAGALVVPGTIVVLVVAGYLALFLVALSGRSL